MSYKRPVHDEAKPNLTPMIDMTFLLVVFFMLTIDLSQKEYVALELPYARSGIEDKEPVSLLGRVEITLMLLFGICVVGSKGA